ncbi:hypothetical protein [Vibrio coralliilyticus]|uniref:hypothetical protein n=1 Tax=Vibrio coralliilyticus TaxID=190893 RepID=UPI000AB9EFFB|nr:hypothetical protein [Vibrio coralliilyticus]
MNQIIKLNVLKPLLKRYLDDPINWAGFIKENKLDLDEQIFWRNHLNLDHIFKHEFEA